MHFVPIPTMPEWLNAWSEHWLPFVPAISRRTKEPVEQLLGQIARYEIQPALVWDGEHAHALLGIRFVDDNDDLVGELVWLTGNNRNNWQHLISEVERYLRDIGCRKCRPICRNGWAPFLQEHGYELIPPWDGVPKRHVAMEKVL